MRCQSVPLRKIESTLVSVHEVASQRIHDHEDDAVKSCLGSCYAFDIVPDRESRQHWFVGKESRREYQYSSGQQEIRQRQARRLDAP